MATPGTHGAVAYETATSRSASRRSSRRSWFDTPPVTPLDFAVERPQHSPQKSTSSRGGQRRSLDEVETLVLSHFTKSPRIGFGKVIVGRSKTRVLLVQNPADYEQEVVLERFPFKKSFNVDHTSFLLQPEEVLTLTLTWTPREAGGCREMILFHINDVYRLQAYMFGTAEDPKPVRKGRKGMLGPRRGKHQPPSSSSSSTTVVQTKSLKSIRDNYSPRRSEELRELRCHIKPPIVDQENVCPWGREEEEEPVPLAPPHTPPPLESTAIMSVKGEGWQEALERRRQSGFLSPTLSKMSPIPLTTDSRNGCIMESYLSTTTTTTSGSHDPSPEGKGTEELRSPLKTVTGNRSQASRRRRSGSRNSYGESGGGERDKSERYQGTRSSGEKPNEGSGGGGEREKSERHPAKKRSSGGKPATRMIGARVHVSPSSFLNDSVAGRTTASSEAEVGRVRASFSSQVCRGVGEKPTVSPNSFVQNMTPTAAPAVAVVGGRGQTTSSLPSPSAVLNTSIPHSAIMKQLQHVRRSLHDASFHDSPGLSSPAGTGTKPASKPYHPSRAMKDRLSQLAQPKSRNVFAHARDDNPGGAPGKKKFLQRKLQEQALFAKIADTPSPRRNTFLIKKQPGRKTSPQKHQQQPQSSRPAGGGRRGDTALRKPSCQSGGVKGATAAHPAERAGSAGRVDSRTVKKGQVASSVPDKLGDHRGLTHSGGAGTDGRRSQWASPAVASCVSPVIAVQSDCDSPGSDWQAQVSGADLQSPQVSHQQVVLTADEDDIRTTCREEEEEEEKERRCSGRRLFPDVVNDDTNLSKDFHPLWAGSATVTKNRPSISPPFPGSANGSKKLFPDIISSAAAPGPGGDTTSTPLPRDREGEESVERADTVEKADMVHAAQTWRAEGRKQRHDTAASEVEIVDMTVANGRLSCTSQEKSHAESSARKAEIVDMAWSDSQPNRGKAAGGLFDDTFDDTQSAREKSWHPQAKHLSSFDWHSPQQLPQSPATASEAQRRSTLTVTKSCPSQALLDACSNAAGVNAATESQLATPEAAGVENDSDELWQSETIVIDTKDNKVVGFTIHREVLTPTKLPTSPMSENSRRSTHAVRNPIVLNKDGIVPRNLFGSVPESKSPGTPEMNDTSLSRGLKSQSCDVQQTHTVEESHQMRTLSDSRQSEVKGDRCSPAVSTDRTEHHLSEERDRITRPAPFCTAPQHPAHDSSLSCQDLSTDSLEAERKSSCSDRKNKEDSISYTKCTEPCMEEDCGQTASVPLMAGRESSADVSAHLVQEYGNDPDEQFFRQQGSCSETHLAEQHGDDEPASLQQSHSHQLTAEDSSTFLSKEKKTASSRKDCRKESLAEEDLTESFTEITPFPSMTSVESKGRFAEPSGPQPALAKETSAKPITSCSITKETLLKKDTVALTMKKAESSSSLTSNHRDITASSSRHAQLVRSLSADLHPHSVRQPIGKPPPAAATVKDVAAAQQKAKTTAKSAAMAMARPQGPGKTRAQGSLERGKQQTGRQNALPGSRQTEQRLDRKRSSPEAGLKAPHSKRVELEQQRSLDRGQIQQTPSRGGPASGPPRVGRAAAKPSRGVALSRLILVKKSKTALPKHPLPFAAKNMYYDERWQDKQERGFVHWLNFVLTPADEYMITTTKTRVDARAIAFDGAAASTHHHHHRLAPTKETLSFRAYRARRRLNQLRRASCGLFQSEALARVVCRLELEVEQRRLAVRTDRCVHADIGLKQKILDVLLSYNPLWLRIGLETVYGEVLPIQTNSDVIGLSRFILTRLLTSPDISAHYSHPTVPHLYHDGYADAVAQHLLKKFLVLVYFLDCAKRARIIAHDPCLFCKDAEIKATKGVLIQFSRDFLSGEGDVTKHLAYMGYLVSCVQTPRDEFDYAVSNLRIDLRDGLRLGRIVMLLSDDWSVGASLRSPAISRLQKIHNVELVMKQLAQRGLDLHDAKGAVLNPRDIVEGHREKTLAFLWKLIFHFQTMATLNEEELREEVNMLERSLRVKVCMQRMLGRPHNSSCAARRDSGVPSVAMDSPMLQLLLKWSRTVCLHYGVKVENFTVSFSDGRALCCLLHHYHPSLLPLSQVHFTTSQSMQEAAEESQPTPGGDDDDHDDSDLSHYWGTHPLGGEMDQSMFDSLLANERENFRILFEKVSELGGIPLMLKAGDMSGTIPDERVVLTYVSYLCARLLDLREETRAARIIQLFWRRFCLRRSARLRQTQIAACLVLQRAWRGRQVAVATGRLEAAAVCLQAVWRGRQARHRAALLQQAAVDSILHQAATTIQTCVRSFLTRQRFQRQVRSAVTIQSCFRAHRARQAFARQRQACLLIQTRFRARTEGAAVRREFSSLKRSAAVLQSAFRRRQQRRQSEDRDRAAAVLQRVWRRWKRREEFLRRRRSAGRLQAWWRSTVARTRFVRMRRACVVLQTRLRAVRVGAEVRGDFVRRRNAAVTLQSHFRGYRYRIKFQALRLAAVMIQRAVRAHQARTAARQHLMARQRAALTIQARFRGHRARGEVRVQRAALRREAAALTVQSFWRAMLARGRLRAFQLEVRRNRAAVKIQAGFRGLMARGRVAVLRKEARRERAGVTIQSAYRRYRAVRQLKALQAAARRELAARDIQAAVRRFLAVRRVNNALRLKAEREDRAAVTIQAAYRGHRAARETRRLQLKAEREDRAAVTIQAAYRGHRAARETRRLRLKAEREDRAAVTIQAAYRGHRAARETRRLRLKAEREDRAAVTIQAAYRGHRAARETRRLQLEARRQAAAVTIQSSFRRHCAVRELRALQLAARSREAGALAIQSAYRGYAARRLVHALREAARRERQAARTIQAYVRGRQQRRRYLRDRRRVLLLQACTRGYLARRNYRQTTEVLAILADYHSTQEKFQTVITELHRHWAAAVAIQSAWRGCRERRAFLKVKASACTLQSAWRGCRERRAFLKVKASVCTLQSAWRGCRERRAFLKVKASACTLQSAWRGCRERRAFLKVKASVCTLQSAWRGCRERRAFLKVKASVCTLQSAWRGCRERRAFLKVKASVCTLQSAWRGCRERRAFLKVKASACTLQSAWRGCRERRAFLKVKASVCTLQSAWRGCRERRAFLKVKASACTLQAAVRGCAQRRCYLRLRGSAVLIQRWFRAVREGRATRLRYQLMVGAAVAIQSCWKMYVIRSYYLQVRARVVRAQTLCRAFLARTRFLRQRQAALCLQRRFRARALGQEARRECCQSLHSIVRLQALFRGKRQREQFRMHLQACVRIQSAVRGWLAWRRYRSQLRSAVVLQRGWRAVVLGREDRERYTQTRRALIVVQAHTRGYLARKQFHSLKRAACVIQNGYRGYQARCQFLLLRQAAVIVQRRVRAFLHARQEQRDFVSTQQACVKIQAAYRGHAARQQYVRCRQSVVRLQALVRGRQQRQRYLSLHGAALLCQRRYRARRLGQVFRTAFLLIREAAVVIQRQARGRSARLCYQRHRRSAITLQAHVRGWLQRRRLREQTWAVVCLQRRWRAWKVGGVDRREFAHTRHTAVTLQRAWRRVQLTRSQRSHRAATVIQKHVRRLLAQNRFRDDMRKTVRLQAAVRGFLARRSASRRAWATGVIQRRWRETLLARRCRRDFLLKVGAAVVIQSVFRGRRTRIHFTTAMRSVTLLQAVFRGRLQCRRYLQLRRSVLSLQRQVRSGLLCRQERQHFLQQKGAAMVVQTAFRRWRRRLEEKKSRAATVLQSYVRMMPLRRRFLRMKAAITVLQSALRGRSARRALRQKKAALGLVQRRVRFYLLVRRLRWVVHRRRRAATTIQRAFRNYVAAAQSRRCRAAVRIQAAFRCFAQRRQFQRQKRAALTLQCRVRWRRDRQRARERRRRGEAAVEIQRCFRARRQRREEELRVKAREGYLWRYASVAGRHLGVVRIQRWYRQAVLMRQARQQLHYIVLLQRRVRAYLQRVRFVRDRQAAREEGTRRERAARVVQSAVREWAQRREEKRRLHLITRVQAVWRGRQLRGGLKNKKIAAARRRVQAANQKATEEKTLRNRTTSALEFLLHYKQLAYILDALMHLDVATRLSWVCCERLVEVGAVGVILRLMLSCNRSLPHMELIKFSVSVLLNLAKYEKTAHAVYEGEDAVTTLVDLMSIYREKGGLIFSKICMLLAILGSDTQRKTEMCGDRKLVEKLQSIHALVLRKQRMTTAARARGVAARATCLNATLPPRLQPGHWGVGGGGAKGGGGGRRVVRPAWVLGRNSVHDIQDPLAALSFLLNTLHIGPK